MISQFKEELKWKQSSRACATLWLAFKPAHEKGSGKLQIYMVKSELVDAIGTHNLFADRHEKHSKV